MRLFQPRRAYLDYASATPILPEALQAMNDAEMFFANPGAIHEGGVEAKKRLEEARGKIAHELGCQARQIIFTSGLTEANNLAILGFARKLLLQGVELDRTHWIVSSIEHDSVLECFAEIERLGGNVSFIEPEKNGKFSPEVVARALRPETVFVSIGWANNEIGVVQPLSDIARLIHAGGKHIVFHSDAGQAPLYRSPHVHTLGVDMLALGAGKLYGPRSSGALYVAEADMIAPILHGGGQEKGLRPGTEDVAPAVGFAKAFELISKDRKMENERLEKLRDFLFEGLSKIPGIVVNGDLKHSLPHMLNVSIPNISSEYVTLALDRKGIAMSTKSACRSNEASSHVVRALGGEEWRAKNTLRFSLGRGTEKRDVERAIDATVSEIEKGKTH